MDVPSMEGVIFNFAKKYARYAQSGGMDLEDLVQAGRMGNLKAMAKFDPSINPHFPTYAGWWIRAEIRTAAMNHSRTVRVGVKTQQAAWRSGELIPLRCVDIDELILAAPEAESTPRYVTEALERALGLLTERNARILRMYFYEDMTLAAIARVIDLSRERVRQIVEQSLPVLAGQVEHLRDHV